MEKIKIITIKDPEKDVLRRKTTLITSEEYPSITALMTKLRSAMLSLSFFAGLAAPQIGEAKAAFIYTPDRDPAKLEEVINPKIYPVGNHTVQDWEACFSMILAKIWKIALVPRYETIDVVFQILNQKTVKKRLSGFAARVFQHEFDHLQGILCIDHPDATVKEFANQEAFLEFRQKLKIKQNHQENEQV